MSTAPVAVADLVSAVRRQRSGTTTPAWIAERSSGSLTRVRGVQPGAGASTVAVALADVAADGDVGVATVVDLAFDDAFGASASIDARADLVLRGWSGGRRGRVRVVRPVDDDVAAAEAIPGRVIVDRPGLGVARRLGRPGDPSNGSQRSACGGSVGGPVGRRDCRRRCFEVASSCARVLRTAAQGDGRPEAHRVLPCGVRTRDQRPVG